MENTLLWRQTTDHGCRKRTAETVDESPGESVIFRRINIQFSSLVVTGDAFPKSRSALATWVCWLLRLPCSFPISSTLLTHGEQEEETWGDKGPT